MQHHLAIVVAFVIIMVVGGCGESSTSDSQAELSASNNSERKLDSATMRSGLDPTDDRIVAFVSWLEREGVTLVSEGSGSWRLTQPETPDAYDVVFSIRSFPAWASEQQMREALDINLAYILNSPVHLAMSYGSFEAATPDALPKSDNELPKLNALPVTHAIQQLFKKYKGD